MSIKIHERYFIVKEASAAIGRIVTDEIEKHGLTYMEVVSILTAELVTWVKYGIRNERHPDDPEKKGDEA